MVDKAWWGGMQGSCVGSKTGQMLLGGLPDDVLLCRVAFVLAVLHHS